MKNILGGQWDPLNFENFQKKKFFFNIVPKEEQFMWGGQLLPPKNYC